MVALHCLTSGHPLCVMACITTVFAGPVLFEQPSPTNKNLKPALCYARKTAQRKAHNQYNRSILVFTNFGTTQALHEEGGDKTISAPPPQCPTEVLEHLLPLPLASRAETVE